MAPRASPLSSAVPHPTLLRLAMDSPGCIPVELEEHFGREAVGFAIGFVGRAVGDAML
jgi:hypothetical protein